MGRVGEYKRVNIDGKTVQVHVYVWEQVNGPVPDGHVVHHRDHNKRNNTLDNLQLMTHAEHADHHNRIHPKEKICTMCGQSYEPPVKHRERSKTCSDECKWQAVSVNRRGKTAVLTEAQAAEIKRRRAAGERGKDLAAEFGVSAQTVCQIHRGNVWAWLP